MSFQEFFQDRWARFLKENFRSPEHIGVVFGVTAVTATNWLNGTTGPRGHCVAQAFTDYPEEATRHLSGESNDHSGRGDAGADVARRRVRVGRGAARGKMRGAA